MHLTSVLRERTELHGAVTLWAATQRTGQGPGLLHVNNLRYKATISDWARPGQPAWDLVVAGTVTSKQAGGERG